ncbi:MAG: wax ester/triacylglycerol synthase family O-acyltransferase [Moraxella sp.]|nr:wax ester/triacylglycerol synthase family O-acyltransferase [Moraxella sp.]
MKALSVIDYLFLFLENHKQPMHIAGLCLFEVPSHADDGFIPKLIDDFKKHQKATFPFNHKLHKRFFWKADEQFDLNHHFRHVKLAPNSTLDTLLDYISQQHGQGIAKDKPLWEFHLIDNICPADDSSCPRFAIWLKIHHSLADGVASMRLLERSLSTRSDCDFSLPFWAIFPKKRQHIDEILPNKKPLTTLLIQQARTIYPVAKELTMALAEHFKPNSPFVSTFDAPKSILNQRITSNRHLSVASFDKSRFTDTAKALSVTTNDLLLAVCSGALRQYLMGQNALPNKPLIAFVPISLRRDDSSTGNQLSFLLTNLGTHLDQAYARLSTIKDSIDDGKRRFSRLTPAQVINYSIVAYGWAGLNLATRALPTRQAFNLIISNVPADDAPLYLHGAKLTGIYPASVLFDGQAMNITLANHQDKIDFGVTACGSVLPNIGQFLNLVADELTVFESIAKSLS